MRIASYNVNGVNGRLSVLLQWLSETQPDIVGLQELKAPQEKFPIDAIQAAGYHAIWSGQRQWNGVAVLSKSASIAERRRQLPGEPDDLHSRYLEVDIDGLTFATLYLPNGNPAPGSKFDYKLRWIDRLVDHAQQLLDGKTPTVLAGDFNIIPADLDVYAPERWRDDALFRPEVRDGYRRLLQQGWIDSLRHLHPRQRVYTFWKYFRNAFQRDAGLRLDHILINPTLKRYLAAAEVDRFVRGLPKTSDHAPVWIELAAVKSRRKRAR